MCDPVTLTLAATAVTMAGQGYSAMAANAQAKYESRLAQQNARLEQGRARDAIERGQEEGRRFRRKASQEMGQQNAALAANGIDIAFGSAADVRGDTAMFAREDALTIHKNAYREAQGYEINAANYLAEGKAARMRGKSALIKGAFDMAGTALGGATQVGKIKAARSGKAW